MESMLAPPTPGGLSIGSLAQANKHKRRYGAIITIEDPRTRPSMRLRFSKAPFPPHLILAFEDCDRNDMGIRIATPEQIERALDFARAHAGEALLIHCRHGIGRSAAIGLAILADRLGTGREIPAMSALLALRPAATPNIPATAIADALLGRKGKLSRALAESEAARPSALAAREMRAQYLDKCPHEFSRI